jgi:hypothetical protein
MFKVLLQFSSNQFESHIKKVQIIIELLEEG